MFSDRVEITVSKIDKSNDIVWLTYVDPATNSIVEKQMSFKEFVRIINLDPDVTLKKPLLN